MFAQPLIDSPEFARQGKELAGEIAASSLPRLLDVLAEPQGSIHFHLRGFPGRDGKLMLELSLEGSCRLRCQRCLEVMIFPVRCVSVLHLVEGELEEFVLEDEDYDSIAASRQLDVAALVEDELLLALPFSPKHAEGECAVFDAKSGQSEMNPFSVLAELKNK